MRNRRRTLLRILIVVEALALALAFGRTRAAPDLTVPIGEIFSEATSFAEEHGVFRAYDGDGRLLGWAASGSESGYGGPMLLVAGIDTLGRVAGVKLVEQRETPIFWRMARAPEYFKALVDTPYDEIDYDYGEVIGVTGATISSGAIVASIRESVAQVAGEAFDVNLPLPARPFEFGLLEIAILILLIAGVTAQKVTGPTRQRIRWASQVAGLIVIGFWKDSPITLAKLAALMSGFFPDPRNSLAIYLLIAGFVVTSIAWGRNIYCLYACPFGAAQRCVGLIAGKGLKLPPWSVRLMGHVRNLIVFAAIFMAFLTLQPALSSYEPFAALFSLHGSTLQWLLLFIVLVASLAIREPWCNFFCPMRSVEILLQDIRRVFRKPSQAKSHD